MFSPQFTGQQNTQQKVLYLLLRTGNVGVLKGWIDVGSPRRSFSLEAGNFCQYVLCFVGRRDVWYLWLPAGRTLDRSSD